MPDILAPAGYIPPAAVMFGALGGAAVAVQPGTPLPVRQYLGAAPAPWTGDASASGVIGSFTPQPGRPIWLRLSGTWAGSITVLRSIDGGTTKLPLTIAGTNWAVFTGNAQEPIGEESEEGATYHLSIALTSGSVSFRVSQ